MLKQANIKAVAVGTVSTLLAIAIYSWYEKNKTKTV